MTKHGLVQVCGRCGDGIVQPIAAFCEDEGVECEHRFYPHILKKDMREISAGPGLAIDVPPGDAFACETPPNMPKMHFLCACVGKRGSGKMVASVNLIHKLKVVDRLFYVSPSAASNSASLERLKHILHPEDLYSDVTNVSLLADIVSKIERERDDYEEYHRKMKRWRAAQRRVVSETPLFRLADTDLLAYHEGKPKHRWDGRVPCMVVFFDDIIGSPLFLGKGAREIARLCLFHRHLGGFSDRPGSVGCSMLFNVQNWKTAAGGLPRALRNNLTLMLLFKTTSEQELKDIAESVDGEISHETFRRLCRAAWKEPHDFLLIDHHFKPNHPSGFRRNFDTYLVP